MKTDSWRYTEIDRETRHRLRGSVAVDAYGTIAIRLPYPLESANKKRGAHWRVRHDDAKEWRARLRLAIADSVNLTSLAGFDRPMEALGLPPVRDPRIVYFERQVPQRREFVRDHDNLHFAPKPLQDALHKAGFLRGDTMRWLTTHVTQTVSEDGRYWTNIRIEIPAGYPIPPVTT